MFDHRVLLVTTGDNRVRQQLQSLCGPGLQTVDCMGLTRTHLFQRLRSTSYAILITYRCPYILPHDIIGRATLSALNIHPSLLPAYAGLNPWDEMLRNDEKHGGMTIHVLTDNVDQGQVIASQSLALDFSQGLTYNRNQADELASVMIREVLTHIAGGMVLKC